MKHLLLKAISNYFNKHFADVPNELVKSLPPKKKRFSEYLKSSTCQSMFTWPTCPQELAYILKNSKNKLSAGSDHIPTKVLKSSPHNILLALSHLFNLSMSKGEFIDCFNPRMHNQGQFDPAHQIFSNIFSQKEIHRLKFPDIFN